MEGDSSNTAHPYAGCLARIDRADAHVEALDDTLGGFLQRRPYRVNVIAHPEREGHFEFRLVRLTTVPNEAPLLLGDAIQNLAAALDRLAWKITGGHADARWPSASGTRALGASLSSEPLRRVPPAAASLLRELRPHGGKDGNLRLRGLHELDTTNRRDTLPVVERVLAIPSLFRFREAGGLAAFTPDSLVEEDRIPLHRPRLSQDIVRDTPGGILPVQPGDTFTPRVDVCFGPGPFHGEPLVPRLRGLSDYTRSIVSEFARLLPPDA